jgi:hypothetical protein
MDQSSMMLEVMLITWGVITGMLAILVIYRGTLSSKEDDQIFIDAAEAHHVQEQQVLIARMSRLTKPIIALSVLSGLLLLSSVGLWIYLGLKSF